MLNMFEEFTDDQGILKFKKMWTEVKREVLTDEGATDLAGRCDDTLRQRKLSFALQTICILRLRFSPWKKMFFCAVDSAEFERKGKQAAIQDRMAAFFEVEMLCGLEFDVNGLVALLE